MAFNTPQDVINRARRLGYISVGQYSDEKALEDFNIVNKQICNLIISEVNEDYFSNFLTATFTGGQNEYTLYDEVNNIDINKVQKVQVKYSDDGELLPVKEIDKNNLNHSLDWYNNEGRDESNPFQFIFDNSLFIYPAPENDVTEGYVLDASLTPTDLAIDDAIEMLEGAHRHLIVEGMIPYIYQQRGLLNEKQVAENSFNQKLSDLIFDLSDRNSTPQEIKTPNLTYFE